jgi:hypothetical protein
MGVASHSNVHFNGDHYDEPLSSLAPAPARKMGLHIAVGVGRAYTRAVPLLSAPGLYLI